MIYGIGIDIEKTDRFAEMLSKHSAITKIYGTGELELLKGINKVESYAANFCAKEAFSKALGTGLRGFRLYEVEVMRDSSGKPFFCLSGRAQKIAAAAGLAFHVSLTHTKDTAAAFVVAERMPENRLNDI